VPRPRFFKLQDGKVSQIMVAAAMEFSSRGYDQASLNGIIGAAGISKGAFYYYFDDKADLFGTVLKWAVNELLPGHPPRLEDLEANNFWPEVEQWMTTVAAGCMDRPWLGGLGRLFYQPPPVATELVADMFHRFSEFLAMYVGHARELGLVRKDLPESLLLAMLMASLEASDRWMADNFERLDEGSMVLYSQKILDAARRLVAPPDGEG